MKGLPAGAGGNGKKTGLPISKGLSQVKKKSITSPLIVLQQEKVEALWEFVAISETLYQCLQNRDFAGIDRELEKRENVTHSIDDIDQRILQVSSGTSPDELEETPEADENSVVRQNLKTLLREAADLNDRCLAQAALLREEFKNELGKTREGWKAARRYLQQAGSAPRFMDIQR
jgi:negative regulator of replication initiation